MEIISLIISIIALTVSLVFSVLTLITRKQNLNLNTYSQFQNSLNGLIDLSQEYELLNLRPEKDKDIEYSKRLGGIKMKRASIAEQAHNLAIKIPELISVTEYTELAKSFYALREYEKAELHHKSAISKAKGPLGIAAKRSYADFLYLTDRVNEGRRQYSNCAIDQTTDKNKEINVKSLKMQMFNEAKINNYEMSEKFYNEALAIISRIGNKQINKDLLVEVENEWRNLWAE